MSKRIEYIDALRGFTMILVVAVHIYSLCFMQGNAKDCDLSYHNFFGLFRMPLFFFISGFVFYKFDRHWNWITLKEFIKNKIRVQLLSTLVFFLLFCTLFQTDYLASLYNSAKVGYWFTYVLFVYFILYIGIDLISNRLTGRAAFNNITIYISLILGLLLYYFINNGVLLNLISPQMTSLLSISKWQYFIFFSFGCFFHKYYDFFLTTFNSKHIMGIILIIFFCTSVCFFFQNNSNNQYLNNIILKFLAALSGIILILFFFKNNESLFSNNRIMGNGLQKIGKRTLDIYFLHYFFLPLNLSFIGKWFTLYSNPLLEFSLSLVIASLVIICCLVVSQTIRLSPTLTYLLLGGKLK